MIRWEDLSDELQRIAEGAVRDHEHRERMARLQKLAAEFDVLIARWHAEDAERTSRERRGFVPPTWPLPPARRRYSPPPARVAWTASQRAFG